MKRVFCAIAVTAWLAITALAACSSQQQPTQTPNQQYTGYPTQGAYPNNTYPQGTYVQPTNTYPAATTTAPATQTANPFPFQIPSNLPALIPSGLIPGWPAST